VSAREYSGLRGLARAPWDAPDTSAADEARELAAAAHQAQCDAGGAAADRDAIAARRRRLMALALSGGAGRVAQRKAMAARRAS